MARTRLYIPEGLDPSLRDFLQGVDDELSEASTSTPGTGNDGVSVEEIFAATASETFLASQLPSNAWGYAAGGTRGGLTWRTDALGVGPSTPFLWRCVRAIAGAPSVGDAVTAQWRTPRLVGRYAVDGSDGADGAGVEYVFASTATATLAVSKRPSNSWGFDSPGTSGGLVWIDGAVALTASLPYLWRAERRVSGIPSTGSAVSDDWTEPRIVGRFGVDGTPGIGGSDGSDGESGRGYEFIFAATNTATIASTGRPLNSWGYDSPATRNGVAWQDAAPGLTETSKFLWRCQRKVVGAPDAGDTVDDTWTAPRIVGRYAVDGAAGTDGVDGTDGINGIAGSDGSDGDDGSDAAGYEYVFAAHSGTSVSTNQLPANSWGYDSPATRNGVAWQDAAPSLTTAKPNLLRAERRIVGTPSIGDTVSDTWTPPVLVGLLGADGSAGTSYEEIFAATASATFISSQLPSNAWGFESPGTVGGLTWETDAGVTADTPVLWRCRRVIAGAPLVGDSVTAQWLTPRVISGATEAVEDDDLNRDGASLAADFVLTATYADVLTVRLTPSTTSKKLEVSISFGASLVSTSYSLRLQRGGATIWEIVELETDPSTGGNRQREPASAFTVDAPGSAAEQTYVLQGKRAAGGAQSLDSYTAMVVEEL